MELIHLFVNFPQKIWQNVPVIINDGEYTWVTEDGGPPLKLFSCIHEEGNIRMTLNTSKASENNLIVANDT